VQASFEAGPSPPGGTRGRAALSVAGIVFKPERVLQLEPRPLQLKQLALHVRPRPDPQAVGRGGGPPSHPPDGRAPSSAARRLRIRARRSFRVSTLSARRLRILFNLMQLGLIWPNSNWA
jgi:hypothetical protein